MLDGPKHLMINVYQADIICKINTITKEYKD
jgi:hypothetical protein